MSTIALTLTTTSITMAGGPAILTASVTNSATVPARIVLGAFGPVSATTTPTATAWTTIDKPLREIPAGATEQYTVTFAPPAGTAAGSYPVRFIAYSADQAPEEHADQAKQVDVVIPAAPPIPPPPKPWWPWAVAAALVLVAIAVGFFVLRPDDTPPPPPPTSPATSQPPSSEPPVDQLKDLTANAWTAIAVTNGAGGVVAVVPGTQLTATFSADGSVTGSGGCNSYKATYSTDGDTIKIGAPGMTLILCNGPGVMQQEKRFIDALQSATTFAVDAGELRLRKADGSTAVAFTKQQPTFKPTKVLPTLGPLPTLLPKP